jgi:hypothetical protein
MTDQAEHAQVDGGDPGRTPVEHRRLSPASQFAMDAAAGRRRQSGGLPWPAAADPAGDQPTSAAMAKRAISRGLKPISVRVSW